MSKPINSVVIAILFAFHVGGLLASDFTAEEIKAIDVFCDSNPVFVDMIKNALVNNRIADQFTSTSFAQAANKASGPEFLNYVFARADDDNMSKFADLAQDLFANINFNSVQVLMLMANRPIAQEKLRKGAAPNLVAITEHAHFESLEAIIKADRKFRDLFATISSAELKELLRASKNLNLLKTIIGLDPLLAPRFAQKFLDDESLFASPYGSKFFLSLLAIDDLLAQQITGQETATVKSLLNSKSGRELLKAILTMEFPNSDRSRIDDDGHQVIDHLIANNETRVSLEKLSIRLLGKLKEHHQSFYSLQKLVETNSDYAAILAPLLQHDVNQICTTKEGRALLKSLADQKQGNHLAKYADVDSILECQTPISFGEMLDVEGYTYEGRNYPPKDSVSINGIHVLKAMVSNPEALEHFRANYSLTSCDDVPTLLRRKEFLKFLGK